MDIQQLRYVVALSQELHFNRAAEKVHVTQPTLSQGIKKIEEELGTLLFERSSRKVSLTPAGHTFLPYAVRALEQVSAGAGALRDASKEMLGPVKIASIPTLCPYLMPSVLIKLRQEAPRLAIELYEEKTAVILDQLKTGQIDFGVLALPVKEAGIASRSIGDEPFFLALSKRHPLAQKNRASLKEVTKERLLILQEGHCFGDQTMEYCKLKRSDERITFQGSSLLSVVKLAAAGDGVTFVPKMALSSVGETGIKYLPLVHPTPSRKIGIIWRLSSPLSKAQIYCMDTIEQALKDIV